MQRKRSREWVEPTEVQKERFKQALGSYTELGDTKEAERDEQQLFARLGRALKSASAKGWRDNYTLSDVSHAVLRHYQFNTLKYVDNINNAPSFKRNTICGNILEKYSAVKRTVEHGSYVQTHIAHCGCVWLCPVCASLIQSRRAAEVEQAVAWADAHGYRTIMITYTASHYANLPLAEFGSALQQAYRKTMDQVKRTRQLVEVGNIKSVEFTFSERNRWHKHFHVIYFLRPESHAGRFFERVRSAWELQCSKVGLLDTSNDKAVESFRHHGCSLTVGGAAALSHYTNKSASEWTVADEVTKSVLKIGRSCEHMTPFQMLSTIATTEDDKYRGRLIRAFLEYACHTKGMHQLDWSNGLKAAVGIEDMSDEQLVDDKQDTAVVVAGLTVKHWHVLRSKFLRIKFYKMLKSVVAPEDAYSRICQFFMDHADNEDMGVDLCCTVLDAKQTQFLEDYEDKEVHTGEERKQYDQLQEILGLAVDECPRTYCAISKAKDSEVFVPMTESQKEWLYNREMSELREYHITSEIIRQISSYSPSEIAKFKAKYRHKMCSQMSLYEEVG